MCAATFKPPPLPSQSTLLIRSNIIDRNNYTIKSVGFCNYLKLKLEKTKWKHYFNQKYKKEVIWVIHLKRISFTIC
jgi:hypothetical protein